MKKYQNIDLLGQYPIFPLYTGEIPLIRIRNPWGNEAEWNGAWSDGSAEWQFIPDEEKENIGLNFDGDGEFWMSYKDFQTHWDQLEICHHNLEAVEEDGAPDDRVTWHMKTVSGNISQ